MGIALLALVDLLSPLQSLANRWMPTRTSDPDSATAPCRVAVRPVRGLHAKPAAESDRMPPRAVATPRPLRVVCTVDAQRRGSVTGRLVLSGRLVDVCAELDRLAALEAAELSRSAGTLH